MDLVSAFSRQARACEALGSPMYAGLLTRLVADLEADGPTRKVLAGHEDDRGDDVIALRLLGGVHRLVLERRAGELAAYYPTVGGTWEDEAGTAAFLQLLVEQPDAAREWLDRPPQTNEVGRAAALMGALLHLPARLRLPVRLFEIGASGGLNLLTDRFAYVEEGGARHGSPDSPLVLRDVWPASGLLAWRDLDVVARLGCDPMPIDIGTTEGRLALTAYVWPDQAVRFERLRGALAVAQHQPPEVRRQGAVELVHDLGLEAGAVTVLWHSVMWQYLDPDDRERITRRIEELGASASDDRPFVHASLEPAPRTGGPRGFLVVLTTWPGGVRRVLGKAAPHGLPVTWD
jgi:hypothetical protein